MVDAEVEYGTTPELTAEIVRAQLALLVHDEVFRSSKRSVAFLRYVVEQTLAGQADQIKERSIGAEVFGRDPAYDTNTDHVVRTAATELRKRLATYYVDRKHRDELRISLVPGSYIPRFAFSQPEPAETNPQNTEPEFLSGQHNAHIQLEPLPLSGGDITAAQPAPSKRKRQWAWLLAAVAAAVIVVAGFYGFFRNHNAQEMFWRPILNTPGPVLIAVGDHPDGPPTAPPANSSVTLPTPVPGSDASETVPFADTVTIARVTGALAAWNKQVIIRRGSASSFSDLRQNAAILVGAFNNEWSLRLTRQLRFSLALDPEKHLIYIRDAKNSSSRNWSWATNQPNKPATGANSPVVQDYALISRIRDSETGHVVVVIGGLYTYGTQAAGEFLTDPALMQSIARQAHFGWDAQNLQIVLATTVTDGTPGPPRVLAVSSE